MNKTTFDFTHEQAVNYATSYLIRLDYLANKTEPPTALQVENTLEITRLWIECAKLLKNDQPWGEAYEAIKRAEKRLEDV